MSYICYIVSNYAFLQIMLYNPIMCSATTTKHTIKNKMTKREKEKNLEHCLQKFEFHNFLSFCTFCIYVIAEKISTTTLWRQQKHHIECSYYPQGSVSWSVRPFTIIMNTKDDKLPWLPTDFISSWPCGCNELSTEKSAENSGKPLYECWVACISWSNRKTQSWWWLALEILLIMYYGTSRRRTMTLWWSALQLWQCLETKEKRQRAERFQTKP